MDPYLEAHWGDIHTRLMVYASTQLNAQLPRDLQARVEESLAVQEDELLNEPATNRHLEVVDFGESERVVTAIEIISPANKVSVDGQWSYTHKQREYRDSHVNLVEIDLIRAGSFVLSIPENRLPASCRTPYLVCTRRTTRPDIAELYPIALRQALPNIPIPLRPKDKDVVLQLQPLVDDCYRDGRYDRMNYRAEPTPRLGEADARWVDDVLRAKGLR
jgi:hypothetical protein